MESFDFFTLGFQYIRFPLRVFFFFLPSPLCFFPVSDTVGVSEDGNQRKQQQRGTDSSAGGSSARAPRRASESMIGSSTAIFGVDDAVLVGSTTSQL